VADTPARGPRSAWVTSLQVTPVVLFLGTFLVAPLSVFLLYSFWTKRGFEFVADWTVENYTGTLGDEVYRTLLRNTIEIALLASVIAVILGYAFAHVVRFYLRRWQAPLMFLVLVAAFSGYLVRVYSWRTILGRNGIVNETLLQLGFVDRPLTFLLYSRTAAVIVLANFLLPIALAPMYVALQNVTDGEIEAARDLGCGPARVHRKVTIPRARPGIFAAFALCFLVASGDYVTPQLVGGTSGTMIGRAIVDAFGITYEWPIGAALSFSTLAVVLLTIGLLSVVTARVVR
jgi:spermidine/putrescine transport system permease protein